MGRELTCRGEGTAGAADGRLLLETDELIFRGPARVRIPFSSIKSLAVRDGWLMVRYDRGEMRFEVGTDAGRSSTGITGQAFVDDDGVHSPSSSA